jgi:3-methyladenine DNA glycosylase/8-oxoguanine DNA glycosylase
MLYRFKPTSCAACLTAVLVPTLKLHTDKPPLWLVAKKGSAFASLAKSVVFQQLAGSAAAAIYKRFLSVCQVSV